VASKRPAPKQGIDLTQIAEQRRPGAGPSWTRIADGVTFFAATVFASARAARRQSRHAHFVFRTRRPGLVSAVESVVFPAPGRTDDADFERHE